MSTEFFTHRTRRHFFSDCSLGLGSVALASLLSDRPLQAAAVQGASGAEGAAGTRAGADADGAAGRTHFPAKARNVIYLFMAGGPSQLELFDYKPKLQELNGQNIPQSFIEGKRFAFMNSSHSPKLLGTRRTFEQRGQSGTFISDLLPHTAQIADEIAIVRSCATNLFNHAPAKLFMNTGSGQFGRPSIGAWVSYGIGSESHNLPGFVVLQSGPRGPRGGAVNWGSGFLPTTHQGVPLRSQGDPILNLSLPDKVSDADQRATLDALSALNLQRLVATGDAEIQTRIQAYEMAYRMQSSAPELIDLSGESPETMNLYGISSPQPSFARNCLLARRLVERGTRFVQLYHTNWDSHGGSGETLEKDFPARCAEVDQACAALIRDLKARGLLEHTLVVWGGEFGRTPMGENREFTGRNHHIDAFTMWFAGAGIRPGAHLGASDELGFNAVEDRAHVHDLHATLLHLLGIDHKKLTFRFQGRDFRLTDVHGEVLHKLLV
jgi:hypothetical protein